MSKSALYFANAQSGPGAVIRDFIDGARHRAIWQAFAWDDIQRRYYRSMLGVAWIVISYLIFVIAITIFFRGYSSVEERHFVYYIALGYASYIFLITNLTDACTVFRQSQSWIKSAPLPYSIYVYKSIARSAFIFAIHIVVAFALISFLGWRPRPQIFLALPALGAYFLNAVWIQFFLGLLAARYSDIKHFIQAITRILFFTTPILWTYSERTGLVKTLADINPFTHFVEIIRAPVIGDPLQPLSWAVVGAITLCGWTVTILTGDRMRKRLPFWV